MDLVVVDSTSIRPITPTNPLGSIQINYLRSGVVPKGRRIFKGPERSLYVLETDTKKLNRFYSVPISKGLGTVLNPKRKEVIMKGLLGAYAALALIATGLKGVYNIPTVNNKPRPQAIKQWRLKGKKKRKGR